jgi:hypothetical protein
MSTPPSTLPPASTFDFLPPLHNLLSRLLADPSNPSKTPLSPKDVATEAAAIKIKIQQARTVVEELPDIDRTIEEQEEEIREMEERIREQRAVLREVAEVGRRRS